MLDKSVKNKKVLTLNVDPIDMKYFISSSLINSSIVVTPIIIDGSIEYYECTIKVNDKIREVITDAYDCVNFMSKNHPEILKVDCETMFYKEVLQYILTYDDIMYVMKEYGD